MRKKRAGYWSQTQPHYRMSASRRQTRSQGPIPSENDSEDDESDTEHNESDVPPARGSRTPLRTPQQQRRARSNPRRRPQEREPEDFNFMPQHAHPGGNQQANQEANAGNEEM